MNKWKNYGLWVSIVSCISLAFTDYLPHNFELTAQSILTILAILGVISNPKDGKGYMDT